MISVMTNEGIVEQVELVLSIDKGKKKYILYKNNDNEIFASYLIDEDNLLHNDLTEEEYDMLEKLYQEGANIYDSKK